MTLENLSENPSPSPPNLKVDRTLNLMKRNCQEIAEQTRLKHELVNQKLKITRILGLGDVKKSKEFHVQFNQLLMMQLQQELIE